MEEEKFWKPPTQSKYHRSGGEPNLKHGPQGVFSEEMRSVTELQWRSVGESN